MDLPFLTTFLEVVGWIMIAAFWLLAIAVFIWVFWDIFRRPDLSGWGRAGWILLAFVFPLIGCLIYIIARPRFLVYDPDVSWAPTAHFSSPVDEVAYAHGLMEQGKITQAEFDDIKLRLGL
jgi:hypothetical protein